MRVLLIFICLILLAPSCKTGQKAQVAPAEVTEWITDESNRKVMRDKEIYAATVEVVPLDSAYLRRDTLHLHTKKMTGCAADEFQLVWNGAMMKSLPPQTSVKLFHRVEPDCKEQHPFHLTFNIAPLRMKRDSAYLAIDSPSMQRATIIRIGGWKSSIRYDY